MNKNLTPTLWFLAIGGFVVGALIGLALVEHWWRVTHTGLYIWQRPTRDWNYFLMATAWSLSFGTLGIALAGYRHLPDEFAATKK